MNGKVQKAIRLGLPAGSLEQSTLELLERAGWIVRRRERSYYPSINDPEIAPILLRPQEMSRYVEAGILDAGLTGKDWVAENESDVEVIADLVYAKQQLTPVRWVLAVPEESPIKTVRELEGKRIATELVGCVKRYLKANGVNAKVEFSWGATEVKAGEFVDAIVDITETGSSITANRLRIIDTIMTSNTQLIANRKAAADTWKNEKLRTIALMLQGAIIAREKVGLKMNLPELKLEEITARLPALRRPTVSSLAEPGWVAIEVIIDEKDARHIIPELKKLGAEGIIEYPLNKVIM
ncbi:MAG TPA: ATP phosphoribosyltransferase [Planctomycetes bacterium]|nr:ATP phosphoribosyltransferase [Planctomycetota bacterium]